MAAAVIGVGRDPTFTDLATLKRQKSRLVLFEVES